MISGLYGILYFSFSMMLKGTKVKSAPSIDYGVNQQQNKIDIAVQLPVDHFLVFKPLLQKMQQGGAAGLFGKKH